MSWTNLTTDYTDATWSGYKKYTMIENDDGTVSLVDVTTYTNKENSFFGASDANAMNTAINYIMSMLENGTDLYSEFLEYFETQKSEFESSANSVIENVTALTTSQYDSYVTYLAELKAASDTALSDIETAYEAAMASYESEQKAAFDTWFETIKDQLSEDVAGNLQNEITELDERLAALEYMSLQNDYSAPLVDDDGALLTDDLGYAILADWKYKEE